MKSSILRTHENCEGSIFIDPEDKEFKETIKNARKKLETSVAPAMPCKIMKKNCGSGGSNKIKTKLACILEADESTRLRMEIQYRIIMKTILQEKVRIHYSTAIWVHKFISYASNSCRRRQRWTRNGKNWRNFRRGT